MLPTTAEAKAEAESTLIPFPYPKMSITEIISLLATTTTLVRNWMQRNDEGGGMTWLTTICVTLAGVSLLCKGLQWLLGLVVFFGDRRSERKKREKREMDKVEEEKMGKMDWGETDGDAVVEGTWDRGWG